MIKLLTFLKPRADLDHAAFKHRWLNIHAPMAAGFVGLRGYMLSFAVDETPEPSANGVAQLWFDDREAAQRSYATEGGRAGSADANQYLSRRAQMLASESWVQNTRSLAELPFKYLLGVKRREGVKRADFVAWWTGAFAQEVSKAGATHGQARVAYDEAGKLLNSGTSGMLELLDKEGVFDGLAEIWFPTLNAMKAAAQTIKLRDIAAPMTGAAEELMLEEFVIIRPPAPAYGATDEINAR